MTWIDPGAETTLELRVVTKRFAGTTALDEVDFSVQRGRSTHCWGKTAPANQL